ncbi:MAG TPA: hypothetical protein PKG74_03150, partial [Candidatus Colwellbacteria bacterium]|nr:hypothetical protein [Candidatus Colwellbacteria bacterium]
RDPVECLDEFLAMMNGCEKHLTHNGFRFDIPFVIEQARRLGAGGLNEEELSSFESKLYRTGVDSAVLFKASKLNLSRGIGESFKQFADRVMEIRAYGLKYNVGVCCDELGIDRSNIKQHRALGDVALTLEIYRKMDLLFPVLDRQSTEEQEVPF